MTNKTRLISGILTASLAISLFSPISVETAQAALNVQYRWIQADDYEENPCMKPDQGPLKDGVVTFRAEITNREGFEVRIDHAAFHDPISGCAATSHTIRTDAFTMTGKSLYGPGETGQVAFDFDVTKFNCGRVQIDAGYHRTDVAYDSTVFLGEVIDYGVDCQNGTPSPVSCSENAALTSPAVIPSKITAGSNVPFKISAYNSGQTWYYHGSYFQLVQTSGFNISPGYGHIGSLTPGNEQVHDFTLVAPTTPGTHSITFQMVHKAGATYKTPDGKDCAPAPALDVYFGNTLTMTFTVEASAQDTGNIIVSSNIPTAWTVMGPQNFSGSGTYASYTTVTGTYGLDNVPVNITYQSVPYELVSITPKNITLTKDTNQIFQISYQKMFVLNAPRITGISNAVCSQLKLTWEDNSDNETGFHIYRSENENQGNISMYQHIATVGANTTTYTDKPAVNKTYYYIVAAYSTSPAKVSPSSPFFSSFNVPCTAAIEGNISVVAVNGNTAYDPNQIKSNDTITLQIMIDNLGPTDAYVTKITNQISSSLINPRNLTVNGPNAQIGSPSISGSHPNYNFSVNGKKEVGGLKWVIRFDATLVLSEIDSMGQFSNCSTVHYFDQTGNKTKNFCLNQLLAKTDTKAGIKFREVAP